MEKEMLDLLCAESDTLYKSSVSIGYLTAITSDGTALVDFYGNDLGPLAARSIVPVANLCNVKLVQPSIVLGFENGDRTLPIILGVIQEAPAKQNEVVPSRDVIGDLEVVADRKRIVIQAEQEIVLRCGKGSIVLNRNGKIVIKGTNLVSRASEQNKIKGSSVGVN